MKCLPCSHPASARRRRRAAVPAALLLSFSCLIAPHPAAAQGGKKPGGGGGGDGVTVNPPIPLVSAPIGYQRVELSWDALTSAGEREDAQPGYGGILFNGISSQGVVVGTVGRSLAGFSEPYRTGVINIDPTTGELGTSMFPLDQMFEDALGELNEAVPPDTPKWRIAYGRSVTASGLVACSLLPEDQAKNGSPRLPAVGDLTTRTLTLLTTEDMGSPQFLIQLTESGHALFQTPAGVRLFHRNPQHGTYAEVTLPTEVKTGLTAAGTSSGINLSMNDALELCFHENIPVGSGTEARIVRYGAPNPNTLTYGTPTFPWQAKGLEAVAVAERNTTSGLSMFYAQLWQTVTTGKGKTAQTRTYCTPYHVHSATSRTPLATSSENATVQSVRWALSDSPDGEEELAMRIDKDGAISLQIYKPKLAARFVVDPFWIPPTHQTLGLIQVSPPYAPGQSPANQYFGGYIGYNTSLESSGFTGFTSLGPLRTFVLIPEGAPSLE
jgi:hypothetical protein